MILALLKLITGNGLAALKRRKQEVGAQSRLATSRGPDEQSARAPIKTSPEQGVECRTPASRGTGLSYHCVLRC